MGRTHDALERNWMYESLIRCLTPHSARLTTCAIGEVKKDAAEHQLCVQIGLANAS